MSEQEMIRQAKNAYHRNFYAKNHDKMVKYQREYRAKKGRPGKWTDAKKWFRIRTEQFMKWTP